MLIAGCCAYYYYYVDTVNSYFLIRYTPPQERESLFGSREYSDPKLEVQNLNDYPDDEVAVKDQTQIFKNTYNRLLDEYKKISDHPQNDNPIIQSAHVNAITSMLDEQRILVRTTHIRKFDTNEALDMIRKHWANKSLDNYAKSNKVEVAVYPISKL